MPDNLAGMPKIGLGTYGLTGADGIAAMQSAISLGYRHFDTAQSYGTEANVGTAIARSGRDRNEFFVTTKITGANLRRIAGSIEESLETLQTDYADLVLIHWPAAGGNPPVSDYIGDLARIQDEGKARLIGVSNFTRRLVDEAIAEIGEGRLAVNQVERHLFLQNHKLADHCAERGIAITAYMPLVKGAVDSEPVVQAIAARHNASPGQIALAYLLALNSIVIPKSRSRERQAINLAASQIILDSTDMDRLAALDRGERHIDPPDLAPDWD